MLAGYLMSFLPAHFLLFHRRMKITNRAQM